jgi:hypothetical protein
MIGRSRPDSHRLAPLGQSSVSSASTSRAVALPDAAGRPAFERGFGLGLPLQPIDGGQMSLSRVQAATVGVTQLLAGVCASCAWFAAAFLSGISPEYVPLRNAIAAGGGVLVAAVEVLLCILYSARRRGLGPAMYFLPRLTAYLAIAACWWGDRGAWTFTWFVSGFVELCGVPLLSAMVAEVAGAAAQRRFARFPEGCCKACGYILQGLAGPRCPECGRMEGRTPDRREPCGSTGPDSPAEAAARPDP